MTIPTIVETHWLVTQPMVHELQGLHDQGMEDWLSLGEMPHGVEISERPPEQTEHQSLLLRVIDWMLGPKP